VARVTSQSPVRPPKSCKYMVHMVVDKMTYILGAVVTNYKGAIVEQMSGSVRTNMAMVTCVRYFCSNY
jgi:hypothetical protein